MNKIIIIFIVLLLIPQVVVADNGNSFNVGNFLNGIKDSILNFKITITFQEPMPQTPVVMNNMGYQNSNDIILSEGLVKDVMKKDENDLIELNKVIELVTINEDKISSMMNDSRFNAFKIDIYSDDMSVLLTSYTFVKDIGITTDYSGHIDYDTDISITKLNSITQKTEWLLPLLIQKYSVNSEIDKDLMNDIISLIN